MKKAILGTALAFVVLSVIGGYGFDWSWTGFQANGTLWDWLSLFLLPITVGLLPFAYDLPTVVLLRVGAVLALALTVLLIGGYGFNWTWTGFQGNQLWDWLHLLLVPVSLAVVTHELGERQKRRREGAGEPGEATDGTGAGRTTGLTQAQLAAPTE